MDIKEFALGYRHRQYPRMPGLMKEIFYTDVSASMLVWSEDCYLVEFYLMFPHSIVNPHSHPFYNLIVFNSGQLSGARDTNPNMVTLTDNDHGRIGNVLSPGEQHWFQTGPKGASFYNVSSWNNPQEQTSATLKYQGLPLGPIHARILSQI